MNELKLPKVPVNAIKITSKNLKDVVCEHVDPVDVALKQLVEATDNSVAKNVNHATTFNALYKILDQDNESKNS